MPQERDGVKEGFGEHAHANALEVPREAVWREHGEAKH